jgi:hypothetical protein
MNRKTNRPIVADTGSSESYTELVTQYRQFAKESAENIIKLAETLVRAKAGLSEEDFDRFCKEVHLEKDGSTFRKLMSIGEKISRFAPFFDRLPNNWTTLYKLASIDEEKFQLVTADAARFHPLMTARDIPLILGIPPRSRKTQDHDVVIDLNGLDSDRKREVYQQLQLLKERFGFQLTPGQTLKGIAKTADPAANDNGVPNGTKSEAVA